MNADILSAAGALLAQPTDDPSFSTNAKSLASAILNEAPAPEVSELLSTYRDLIKTTRLADEQVAPRSAEARQRLATYDTTLGSIEAIIGPEPSLVEPQA